MKTICISSHQGLFPEAMGSSLLGVSPAPYKTGKRWFPTSSAPSSSSYDLTDPLEDWEGLCRSRMGSPTHHRVYRLLGLPLG